MAYSYVVLPRLDSFKQLSFLFTRLSIIPHFLCCRVFYWTEQKFSATGTRLQNPP